MLNDNKLYTGAVLKIFILIFIFSALFYGCAKKPLLFWDETYYYDIAAAKEAINNSANKTLDNVPELSAPLFNNNLLIIVPLREMASWAKGEKHYNSAPIGLVLETGLQIYASAIKKHNMFKEVVIISSEERIIDRTSFDYTLYVGGLEPRTDSPKWIINRTGYNIEMPFQFATENFFTEDRLNTALNNLKNNISKINEIISSINEYKQYEKFMK
jgi:hypothetical protein